VGEMRGSSETNIVGSTIVHICKGFVAHKPCENFVRCVSSGAKLQENFSPSIHEMFQLHRHTRTNPCAVLGVWTRIHRAGFRCGTDMVRVMGGEVTTLPSGAVKLLSI